MYEKIQIFKSEEFGQIRTVVINSEPYFVGKDVTEILGYSNSRDALAKHVDDEDKGVAKCDTLGGVQALAVINESGLYSLVLSSKLPSAKRFRKWVTSEVLPSIRKNGGYISGQEEMTDEQLIAKALTVANRIIENKQAEIERMKPKEIFADAVAASHTSILVRELAKILKGNGISIGQNRLFNWLRDNGYLIKSKGTDWNSPTQRAMEMGLFTVKESTRQNPDGSVSIDRVTKVTGRGQQYFINKFLSERGSNKGGD